LKSELAFTLDDLKKEIKKYLYLEDYRIIDVMLGTYIANKFKTDPLWLLVIAPPSNAKTEIMRGFLGHPDAYFLSNLTPSTLVSGQKPKGGADPSLLLQLNDKLVILKDFTTVLSMRSENQQEILAQLREAYDGHYKKAFGNGKVIEWKGRFGVLAACTPIWDAHYAVIGAMGERFLLYRTGNRKGIESGLRAQQVVGREEEMRQCIQKGIHTFINQFQELQQIKFEKNEDLNRKIVALANLTAHGRCPVKRDRYHRDILYQPEPEGTPRLVKQFMQIGMALGIIQGKNRIDNEVYAIVKKIGCDLIPQQRLMAIRELWNLKIFPYLDSWIPTTEIGDILKIPGGTMRLNLEDLMTVGLVNRARGVSDSGRPPYMWQLSKLACDFISWSEVFDE